MIPYYIILKESVYGNKYSIVEALDADDAEKAANARYGNDWTKVTTDSIKVRSKQFGTVFKSATYSNYVFNEEWTKIQGSASVESSHPVGFGNKSNKYYAVFNIPYKEDGNVDVTSKFFSAYCSVMAINTEQAKTKVMEYYNIKEDAFYITMSCPCSLKGKHVIDHIQ